jgi:hypothetical protein
LKIGKEETRVQRSGKISRGEIELKIEDFGLKILVYEQLSEKSIAGAGICKSKIS